MGAFAHVHVGCRREYVHVRKLFLHSRMGEYPCVPVRHLLKLPFRNIQKQLFDGGFGGSFQCSFLLPSILLLTTRCCFHRSMMQATPPPEQIPRLNITQDKNTALMAYVSPVAPFQTSRSMPPEARRSRDHRATRDIRTSTYIMDHKQLASNLNPYK